MPIEVTWYDDTKTIIQINVIGRISEWQENNDAFAVAWTLAHSVSYPVYVLLYAGSEAKMPKGSPLPHLDRNLSLAPENVALIISVVASLFERTIIEVVKTANRKKRLYNKMFVVSSNARALDMINKDKTRASTNLRDMDTSIFV